MPRKIELREFKDNNEFGYAVDVYAPDGETRIKSRIFSALQKDDHFLLRTYDIKANFLTRGDEQKDQVIEIKHDRLIAISELHGRAKKCLEAFKIDYAIFEDNPQTTG